MKVLVFGCWDEGDGYPRTTGLLAALATTGAEVLPCRVPAPAAGRSKQQLLRRPWLWPSWWLRQRAARRQALAALREAVRCHQPDLVLVPYPGHLAVHWARQVWRGPLVLDLFLSAYDTAVLDRQLFPMRSPMAAWLRRLDRRAVAAADLVLMDTPQNVDFLRELCAAATIPATYIPLCFQALPDGGGYRPPDPGETLELLFFGTGVPLHGLSVLIEAVRQTEGVRLSLCGGSPRERELARSLPAAQLRLLPEFISSAELEVELRNCHLVAGIFAAADKAMRVIPCKVAMALAAGRPVLTAASPAVSALLRPGTDCLVVPPADPAALAARLEALVAAPQTLSGLAQAARLSHAAGFSPAAVGERLGRALAELCARDAAPSLKVSRAASPEPLVLGRQG